VLVVLCEVVAFAFACIWELNRQLAALDPAAEKTP
jgi:hypothetical protein